MAVGIAFGRAHWHLKVRSRIVLALFETANNWLAENGAWLNPLGAVVVILGAAVWFHKPYVGRF